MGMDFLKTEVSEVPAIDRDRQGPFLTGSAAIGRAAGDYCGKTILRWFKAGTLKDLVFKGPCPNSPLRIQRANLPRLRELASKAV